MISHHTIVPRAGGHHHHFSLSGAIIFNKLEQEAEMTSAQGAAAPRDTISN